MKKILLVFIITIVTQNCMPQENNDLYIKALYLNIDEKVSTNTDTILVQKDIYIPDDNPKIIQGHTIKYVKEKEIEKYDGNKIILKKIFPIQVKNELLVIRIANFNYSPESRLWVGFGGSYYKFKFDCKDQRFKFFEKTDYGI